MVSGSKLYVKGAFRKSFFENFHNLNNEKKNRQKTAKNGNNDGTTIFDKYRFYLFLFGNSKRNNRRELKHLHKHCCTIFITF